MKLQLILHSVTLISFWTTSLSSKISDLKLCADKNCENVISYARTLAKHRQNDPIFLSFDRNEIVEITSKSAGSRPDLWGGKIGERKGYFPRSFVREYKVEVSNPQNVLTTQEIVEEKEPEKLEEKEEPKEEENPKKDDTDETELDSDDEEEDRWWENEEEEDDEGDGDKTQKEEKEEKTKDEKGELKDGKVETKEEKVESKEDTPESQKAEESPTEKKPDTTEVDETEILDDDDDKADEDEGVKDVKIDKQDSVKTDTVVEMEMDKQGDTQTDKQEISQSQAAENQDSHVEKDEGEKKGDTDSTKSQEESDKGTVQNVTEESSKDVPPPEVGTPKEDKTEIKTQETLKEKIEENKDVKTEDEDDSDTEIQEENGDEIVEDETEIKEDNDVPENNTEEDTGIKEEAKVEKEETKPEEPDGNVKNREEEQTLNEKEAGSTVIDGTTLNIQPSATLAEDKVTEEKKEKETLAGSSDVESFNTILPSSDQSVYSTLESKVEKSDVMEGYTMIDGTPFPLDVLEDVSEPSPAEKTKPIESSAATTISPSKTDLAMQTEDALKHPPKEDIPADKVHVDSVKKDMNVQTGVNEFEQPSAESIEKSESENKTEIADEKVQAEKVQDKSSEPAGSPLDQINTLGQQEGLAKEEQKENVQEVASEGTTQPEMIEVSTESAPSQKLDDKEKNVLEEYKSSVSEAVKAEDVEVKDEVKPVEDALKNRNEEFLSDTLIKEELLLDKEVVQENNESVNTQEQQNAVQQDQPEVLVAKDGRTDNVNNVETTTMSPVDSAVKPPTMDMDQSGVSDVKEKTDVDEQKEANITPPDISPSSPSVSLQSSMDPQSYTGRQAMEMSPQVTENQTEAEVKPNVDRTPDVVSDAYATRSFVSRQVLSHGAQQPPSVVGSDSETEASKKVGDAGSEGSKVVSDDSKAVSSDDSKTVNDDSKTFPDGSETVPDDSKSIDDSTTVKPLEDSTVKPQDSTMSTPEDTTSSSKASTVTEVNDEPSVDQILTEPTGKPDVPSAAASQPWNVLPATVTKAIVQKLPPSLQSFLEQEPLGLSPQAIVLITIVTMTSLLLLTFISCLCQGRGKRKKDPVLVIREIEEKLFVVTKEKENLEDEVQDLQRKLQTVEDDFVTQQSTAESSQTDLQTYKLHNDVMKQTVQTQEADIKKLQGELKQKNKELKTMETQVKEKSAQIQKTESKLTEASGNLVKADEEKKEKSDEITSLQKETERLKDIVEQLETSKSQLKEEVDVWSEKVKSMTDQLDYAKSEQKQMADDLALKENELEVLRDCFLQLKTFQNEEDNEDAEKIEEKLQSMMNVSRVSARLRSMEEESNNLQMRLDIEMQGRKDLEEKILDLERKSEQLTIEKMKADRQHQESLTKLEVLSTYFKQKELEMQRELGEQEALKKEKQSRLENADSRSKMIQEELDTYRSQVEDLKREIASAERDFRGQISSNEKKAHENWLAARAAERELKESRHETSVLRQKLTDLERRLMQGPPPNLIRPLPTRGIPPPGMLRSPPPFDRPGSRGGMPPHPSSSRDDDMSGPQERLMAPNDRRIPDHPEGHKPRLPPPPHDLRSPPPFDRRHMPPRSPPPYDRGMRFPIHPSERRSPAQRVPYPEGPPPPHPPPHLRGQPYPGQGPNTPRNDSLYNTGAHTPPYSSAAKNQESRQQSQV